MTKKLKLNFAYDASLRIMGCGKFHDEIFANTGIVASNVYRKGEIANQKTKRKYIRDGWILNSPLRSNTRWEKHVEWIWSQVSPHKRYFKNLIRRSKHSDICLGCMTDCLWPLLGIDHASLRIFEELPLSLSFNLTID